MKSAVILYRIANFLFRAKVPFLPTLIDYLNRVIFSCWVPHNLEAGKGLVLGYGGLSIVIHSNVKIGIDVHIDQCVTIGGNGTQFGVPKLGDNIYIGSGAKVLGPIIVGDGSVIASNSVVIKDVPKNTVVAGVPAKIIKQDIDIDNYLYHKRVKNEYG